MEPHERLAVIDLGSNSFRLVVFMAHDGWWKRTDEIYEPVRIGQGLAATGRLGEKPIERALATLDVFAHFCRASGLGAAAVDAVATSAIRDAENADTFLETARRRSGLPIRVLSREEEARYGYIAAVNSTTLSDGYVLDLGGGSMQLVHVAGRLALEFGSWPIGTVRMTERFLPVNGAAKRKQIEELRDHVASELEQAAWLADDGPSENARRLVGIGGTVRNLAAASQRAAGLPSNGVQGMVIERKSLDELTQQLASLPAAERSSIPGIKPARADLILAGAVVVQGVLRAGGFDGLETTEAGLREGVFFERLLADRRPTVSALGALAAVGAAGAPGTEGAAGAQSVAGARGAVGAGGAGGNDDADRAPLFENVRRTSVLNLAARYHPHLAHTRHVAALALGMFDELAGLGVHDGEATERELLWAASMLHDIGMSVDYDDHHKHSRYLILNGGLPGFSPVEVAIIAQAARYHRKGMPEPGPLEPLFGPGDAAKLDRCAVLLRLAEDLERSRDQLVRGTRFTLSRAATKTSGGRSAGERNGVAGPVGEIELRLIAAGDPAVPRWAAGRETELFARAFRSRLTVVA